MEDDSEDEGGLNYGTALADSCSPRFRVLKARDIESGACVDGTDRLLHCCGNTTTVQGPGW